MSDNLEISSLNAPILFHNIEDNTNNEVEEILLSTVSIQTRGGDKKRNQEVKIT